MTNYRQWQCGCGETHLLDVDVCSSCGKRRSTVFVQEMDKALGKKVAPDVGDVELGIRALMAFAESIEGGECLIVELNVAAWRSLYENLAADSKAKVKTVTVDEGLFHVLRNGPTKICCSENTK